MLINNLRPMNKFKYKNVKFFYYLKNLFLLLVPRIFYRLKLKSELNKLHQYNRQYILSRVNYYNKEKNQFNVFVNGDARGYALKLKSEFIKDKTIHRDWGGYGILLLHNPPLFHQFYNMPYPQHFCQYYDNPD